MLHSLCVLSHLHELSTDKSTTFSTKVTLHTLVFTYRPCYDAYKQHAFYSNIHSFFNSNYSCINIKKFRVKKGLLFYQGHIAFIKSNTKCIYSYKR